MELNDVLLEIKEFSLQPSKWNRRSTGKKLLTPLTFYFSSLPLLCVLRASQRANGLEEANTGI